MQDPKTIIELSFQITDSQKEMLKEVIPLICDRQFHETSVYDANEYVMESDFSSTIAQNYIKQFSLDSIDWKDY